MIQIKKILFILVALASGVTFAQVGVGNTDPKATLDVNKSSYLPGEQAGIAVTQLTATQIEGMNTTGLKSGTLVYATTGSGSTINSIGYWFYNGSTWVRNIGPQGPAGTNGTNGTNGSSAYQIAVAGGYVGTEAQWLASLVGPQGPAGATGATGPAGADGTNGTNGTNGSSAYQIAVAGGYVGTEAQWLASLVGPQGPAGAAGAQGPIGLTGPAGANGSDATVTGTAPINVTSGVVSLNDAGVTSAKIADNAVTIAKLPAGASASTYLRGDGTWVSIPTFTSVTYSKNSTYVSLDANEVTPNNVTTITFIGSSPANFTISNLPAGASNVGKILNIYNAGGSNINGSFNRSGDGSAQSLTINSGRGFSMVWDGQGWARTSY